MRTRLSPAYEAKLAETVKKIPFAYGNHWIAQKGDRTLHIVGTQHSSDSRMGAMMRKLRPIIKSVDAVYLESTSRDIAALLVEFKKDPSMVAITRGPLLHQMMSEENWRLLVREMRPYGIGPQVVAHIQPWYLSSQLFGSNCGRPGVFSQDGLDVRIEKVALNRGIPVGALEQAGASFKVRQKVPMRDHVKLLEMNLTSNVNIDDQFVTLTNAYFDGTLSEAMVIQEWTMYQDLNVPRAEVARLLRQNNAQMLDTRNRAWMPVILRSKAQNLLVAVGAAHLPGRFGLLNLLKGQGYKMTRVDK